MLKKLSEEDIYKKCDPSIFKAETTEDISGFDGILGQENVKEALALAIGVNNTGYNVFALGQGGIGKKRLITNYLKNISKNMEIPNEFCYVHNFKKPENPLYLKFAAGEARNFKEDIDNLVSDLKITIPAALEGDSYQSKVNQINQKYTKKQDEKLLKIKIDANNNNLNIAKTPQGFVIIALNPATKQPFTNEEINALPEKTKEEIEEKIKTVHSTLEDIVLELPTEEKSRQEKIQQLKEQTIKKVLNSPINKLIKKWQKYTDVENYLNEIKNEILSDFSLFYEEASEKTQPNLLTSLGLASKPKKNMNIFAVNVIVEQNLSKENKGAPVVVLNEPTYQQLFGKIEYVSQFGYLSTNLTLIKAGALHIANGGYLVINARPLLEIPNLWNQLKRVIKTCSISIAIENLMSNNVAGMEPTPIPFTGKIILLGDPDIYNALWTLDPEFKELFKITAEFANEVDYNQESALTYAKIASSAVKKENLLHLNKEALAKLVEIGARATSSQNKLTTNVSLILDTLREANFVAKQNNHKLITLDDISKAFEFRKERLSRIPNFIKDKIKDQTILVQTEGEEVGQINGLSIISINEFLFGQPQRISCTVYQGQTGIVDIERNVNLAGAIYSKGVLILSAFLHGRFSQNKVLSFAGTLNFEQSYSKVDGDSASAAEAFVLMSSLANVPIKQCFAVTGSIDQKGRVQAIGGVNEKIEGFFDICNSRGLNGSHAVIIPKTNVKDLMLKKEIREAVTKNLFSIYAIEHVDEGIELLTGMKAGEKNKKGDYPKNTINYLISNKWVKDSKISSSK